MYIINLNSDVTIFFFFCFYLIYHAFIWYYSAGVLRIQMMEQVRVQRILQELRIAFLQQTNYTQRSNSRMNLIFWNFKVQVVVLAFHSKILWILYPPTLKLNRINVLHRTMTIQWFVVTSTIPPLPLAKEETTRFKLFLPRATLQSLVRQLYIKEVRKNKCCRCRFCSIYFVVIVPHYFFSNRFIIYPFQTNKQTNKQYKNSMWCL